jgi:hypothetical protein
LVIIQIGNPNRRGHSTTLYTPTQTSVVLAFPLPTQAMQSCQGIGLVEIFLAAADYDPAVGIHRLRPFIPLNLAKASWAIWG